MGRSGSRTSGTRRGPSGYELKKRALKKEENKFKKLKRELGKVKKELAEENGKLARETELRKAVERQLDSERERVHALVADGVQSRLKFLRSPF